MEKHEDADDVEGFCSSRNDDQQEFPNACREARATCSAREGNSSCKDAYTEGASMILEIEMLDGRWGPRPALRNLWQTTNVVLNPRIREINSLLGG